MNHGFHSRPSTARHLFAPIAPSYELWARILSMGQDARWRRAMVEGIELPPGSRILDVAAGTGSITRALEARGFDVFPLDQSREMITHGSTPPIIAGAEHLPIADSSFDGVTFGYLLRYVSDVTGCLAELTRVLRPGGVLGMVEFGRPHGLWFPPWWAYTRWVLPLAGALIRSGWREVGNFLGPSIDEFAERYPPDDLAEVWRKAGLLRVRYQRLSLGGGLVMWGWKP